MLAKSVPDLADLTRPAGMALEPKFDGFRVIAFNGHEGAYLQSRTGRALTQYFPDVAAVMHQAMPAHVVLDGELVVWNEATERTNFSLLQRRISAGRQVAQMAREFPAHLIAFDLLQDADRHELLPSPLSDRRTQLEQLLVDAPTTMTLCPQTTSVAEATVWSTEWTDRGVEGVVAKRTAEPYRPGARRWLKYRSRSTIDAIVGGVTGSLSSPETLLLGRADGEDRLLYVGRTSVLNPALRREIVPFLISRAELEGATAHPWPEPLPASWTGHFDRPRPLPYVQVVPTLVVEVLVDAAMLEGHWRHPVRFV